ncbi:hypothetical protein U1Q18_019487 [Sarracenia purpurea var. burkii]
MALMMRSVAVTTTKAVAATALPVPAVFALASPYPSSSSSSSSSSPLSHTSKSVIFSSLSSNSILRPDRLGLVKCFALSPLALSMDAPSSDHKVSAQTEYMVDMKCDGCVNAVKNKLETVDGVKNVDVDLSNQVVRVLGSSPVKTMTEALEQTGRKVRLIGQGIPEDFLVAAAVAEFKGPDIFGVVRLAQVNMELARIEASFSGLSPGNHGWSINEFGDLTKGPSSTGKVFNPNHVTEKERQNQREQKGDVDYFNAHLFYTSREMLYCLFIFFGNCYFDWAYLCNRNFVTNASQEMFDNSGTWRPGNTRC